MSTVSARQVVYCPAADAAPELAAFIAAHRTAGGDIRIILRIPFGPRAGWQPHIDRTAAATFYPLQTSAAPFPTYSVTWTSLGGAPFPDFAGALAIERNASQSSFTLLLSGYYEPPRGAAGKLFDVAFGQRIAGVTARELVHSIAAYIEAARFSNAGAGPAVNRRSKPLLMIDEA